MFFRSTWIALRADIVWNKPELLCIAMWYVYFAKRNLEELTITSTNNLLVFFYNLRAC